MLTPPRLHAARQLGLANENIFDHHGWSKKLKNALFD